MRISDWSSDVCSSDLARRHDSMPIAQPLRQPGHGKGARQADEHETTEERITLQQAVANLVITSHQPSGQRVEQPRLKGKVDTEQPGPRLHPGQTGTTLADGFRLIGQA